MNFKTFKTYCLSKPGVTEAYPMKGEVVWMKVSGKMFAMTNVKPLKMDGEMVSPYHFINLKCDPERALALRKKHSAIKPGWHQNKTHWNTLLMGKSTPDALVKELTDHSYNLVVASLPKKQREGLK
ncbi:MAG: MmcQ/YjbR family DNA-binding protein [Alphaproteobacteria bacterium]|nr:MmcQ/YjbR family DNA-binding protein [Alphaproteobacteria bacterium]